MPTITDSTQTTESAAAPPHLFSAITDYGHGHVAAEHYSTQAARQASLIERTETFLSGPDVIPEAITADEARLAALLSAFLLPATVSLSESRFDGESYRPLLR